MAQDGDHFEVRPGRIRSRGGRRAGLQAQILARVARRGGNPRRAGAAPKTKGAPRSGRYNARGRGAKLAATFPRVSGWSFDRSSGVRLRARRVTVKARVVKLAGKAGAVGAHLRYLERDGTSREGEPGRFYSTFTDEADGREFAERGSGDRHQFRFIVSPEDGARFEDLRSSTRQLMAQMEKDLGTNLDWVAVDHFDTGHPHTHVLVRGVTEDGKTLNIAGDYIAYGVRHRASEIMTRTLGPQSELELREQLSKEVDAERLTRLDRAIIERAQDNVLDLRAGPGAGNDPEFQQLLVGRARQLEKMDLAEPQGSLSWSLSPDLERTLGDLGRRGDIIRTMHKAMTVGSGERRPELFAIHDPARDAQPIIGQVVAHGVAGDYHDRRYLIVDGIDGRTHYVDIGTEDLPVSRGNLVKLEPRRGEPRPADRTVAEIAAASDGRYSIEAHRAHDPTASEEYARSHVRRLEAIRRATGAVERDLDGSWTIAPDHLDRARDYERDRAGRSPVAVTLLSATPVEQQVATDGPTWLDRELAARAPLDHANHGFGNDLERALLARRNWVLEQQVARLDAERANPDPDLPGRQRLRDIGTIAQGLANETGMDVREAVEYERVDGVLKKAIDTSSGKFAVIEGRHELLLVPWRPELEKLIDRTVTGIAHGDSAWEIGRGLGLGR
jgi:type IV secretory pathway VirD2 relaxase